MSKTEFLSNTYLCFLYRNWCFVTSSLHQTWQKTCCPRQTVWSSSQYRYDSTECFHSRLYLSGCVISLVSCRRCWWADGSPQESEQNRRKFNTAFLFPFLACLFCFKILSCYLFFLIMCRLFKQLPDTKSKSVQQ